MSRYIDADALKETMMQIANNSSMKKYIIDTYIDTAPTADVKPIVYGEWIEHKWAEETEYSLISNYECSICHTWENKKSYFCPCCGSNMRKESEEK